MQLDSIVFKLETNKTNIQQELLYHISRTFQHFLGPWNYRLFSLKWQKNFKSAVIHMKKLMCIIIAIKMRCFTTFNSQTANSVCWPIFIGYWKLVCFKIFSLQSLCNVLWWPIAVRCIINIRDPRLWHNRYLWRIFIQPLYDGMHDRRRYK